MRILPRPFPVTYILGWHQHEISHKERVNPELKGVEVFTQTFSHDIHSKLKKKRNVLEQEILLPMRPTCLRQKNVKKKECLPPPQRGLRLGLLINLPKLTFSWPHELYHARLFCPPLSPGVCSDSCPFSWWCYLTISPSAAPFTFCLQYFPGSFPMSLLLSSNL